MVTCNILFKVKMLAVLARNGLPPNPGSTGLSKEISSVLRSTVGGQFMRDLKRMAVAALVGVAFVSSSASANLVLDPGFESSVDCTNQSASWSGGGAFYSDATNCPFVLHAPHSGLMSAAFGTVSSLGFISQAISTSPGQIYDFTFWLAGDNGFPNEFVAIWGGNQIFDQVNVAGTNWVQYSFVEIATSSSTTIAFGGQNGPSWLRLDDVSVTVPEPPSLALVAIGLIGICGRRRIKMGSHGTVDRPAP
jgi:PEP-CTERM motif